MNMPIPGRKQPCHGCPDRYPACSDHCKKEAFLDWKEEQATIKRNREKYRGVDAYVSDQIRSTRRYMSRHSRPDKNGGQ